MKTCNNLQKTNSDTLAAQKELDSLMELYYSLNDDGGSPDEIYRILLKVARKYSVNEESIS